MFEKSVGGAYFYRSTGVSDEGFERFESLPTTAGPWTPDAQHGGPPAALLARGIERLDEATDRVIGRFTMELWGPVPVGPVAVRARVLRPGTFGRPRRVGAVRRGARPGRRDRPGLAVPAGDRRAARRGAAARRTRPADGAEHARARRSGTAATSTRSSGGGSRAASTRPGRAWCGCGHRVWSRASRSRRCSGCWRASTRRRARVRRSTYASGASSTPS